MIYLLLMLYSNILVMGNEFVIMSIYWIIVHTVFKRCFWWPVYKGKKIAVYNFVAPGILSPTWWFLHPRPWNEMKKIFKPRMVLPVARSLHPVPCDTVGPAVSPWLCLPCACVPRWATLTHLTHYVIPYPLYAHISLCLYLCVWPEVGVVMAKKLWVKLRSIKW